jgi:hypothetical protein
LNRGDYMLLDDGLCTSMESTVLHFVAGGLTKLHDQVIRRKTSGDSA